MEDNITLKVLSFFLVIHFSVNSKVPVYIWRKQSLESFPPVTALEDIDGKTFEENYLMPLLQQNETLVVYSQNTFSLEDLSSQNENGKKIFQNLKESVGKQPSLLLPSVHDPTLKLALLNSTYKMKEIELNENFVEDIVTPVEENDIIFLRLPDSRNLVDKNKMLSQNDDTIKDIHDMLSKVKKPITFLYTGYGSSWDVLADEGRSARHLLAVDDPGTYSGPTFLNFSDCGILYAQNVTANLTKNNTESMFEGSVIVTSEPCVNSSPIKFGMTLHMDGIDSANLTMEFVNSSDSWVLNKTELTIKYKGDEETVSLKTEEEMNVPTGFSFSCWQLALEFPQNHIFAGDIIFKYLQVQPFRNAKDKFSSSFDCVPFFTIPIWTGFLVVMLFTGILAFGIYMLFNIRTMDKFDDPKGKTISVPTGE